MALKISSGSELLLIILPCHYHNEMSESGHLFCPTKQQLTDTQQRTATRNVSISEEDSVKIKIQYAFTNRQDCTESPVLSTAASHE